MEKTGKTVSLCMIVRDEEANIEQCLSSAKAIVDELIVVDTGSTDKTKDIAKRVGAKIFDFKWVDDFSAARNESIKHATKDWVLVLDADETLEQDSVKAIKEMIGDKEADAFLFLQKNYTNESSIAGFVNGNIGKDEKYAGWYGSLIVRLFRNRKGYEFSGTVHELVEPSIEAKEGKIKTANVSIRHYGNADPQLAKKKRSIYLELCKKKVKRHPDSQSYFELGVLFKENWNSEEAINSLKKAVELNPKHGMALYELGVLYEAQKDYDEAIKNYKESLKINGSSEAFQNLGVCCFKKGMLKEAYRNLVKAMLLNPNKYTIYNNIGAVMEKLGNYDSAINMLMLGIKLNPNNTVGYYNLGIVFDKKRDFANAIKNYERAVELGHKNKEEIRKRIKQLEHIMENNPKYGYSFKIGG